MPIDLTDDRYIYIGQNANIKKEQLYMNGWILEKCEDSWRNYLTANWTPSVTPVPYFYTGNEESVKEGPAVIAYATDAAEVQESSGIYSVTVVLHLAYPYASGSLDNRNQIAEEFSKKIYNNPMIVPNLISNTTNLEVMAIYFKAHNNGFEGDCWISNNLIDMIVANKQ